MIHWPRGFTAPEMWFSEKRNGTQHRMLQTKGSWMSTSAEMSSRTPNLQGSSQPEMKVPNIKLRTHWTTSRLRIVQSQTRSHGHRLALRHHWELHGSHRPMVVAETALASWQTLHTRLSKMRNLRIWFPSKLQLWSPTIVRMASTIQSLTKQQPSLCSPSNGIWQWMKS